MMLCAAMAILALAHQPHVAPKVDRPLIRAQVKAPKAFEAVRVLVVICSDETIDARIADLERKGYRIMGPAETFMTPKSQTNDFPYCTITITFIKRTVAR